MDDDFKTFKDLCCAEGNFTEENTVDFFFRVLEKTVNDMIEDHKKDKANNLPDTEDIRELFKLVNALHDEIKTLTKNNRFVITKQPLQSIYVLMAQFLNTSVHLFIEEILCEGCQNKYIKH